MASNSSASGNTLRQRGVARAARYSTAGLASRPPRPNPYLPSRQVNSALGRAGGSAVKKLDRLAQSSYFAYGSNLNEADLKAWCEAERCMYPFAGVVTRAFLPDHEYIFNVTSARRGGGVLNLRGRTAQAVHGVVFRVRPKGPPHCVWDDTWIIMKEGDDGWVTLDKKEDAPNFYRRVPVTVFDAYGEPMRVMTYRVPEERAESTPVPASAPYVEVVKQGLRAHDLVGEAQLDAAARGEIVPLITDRLFVYGTLMAGEPQELRIQPDEDVISWVPATVHGKLYALDDLPCLLPAKDSIVHGECIRHKNLDALFLDIDFYEGFRGYRDLEHSLYYRALTFCETKDGKHLAWAYFARSVNGAVEVPSGDWRSR